LRIARTLKPVGSTRELGLTVASLIASENESIASAT